MKHKIPEINLKELDAEKKRNIAERRKFLDLYAEWLKRTPNSVWSRAQNILLDK